MAKTPMERRFEALRQAELADAAWEEGRVEEAQFLALQAHTKMLESFMRVLSGPAGDALATLSDPQTAQAWKRALRC